MAIKSIGELEGVFNRYDANKWIKSADFDTKSPYSLKDSPAIPFQNGEIQKSFGDFLADSVAQVNSMQVEANQAVEKLVTGKTKNIHETMLQIERADIAFKTMNQIRSKVIDAYKEVMRMQI